MKAQIQIQSYDTSLWGGFERTECKEAVSVVKEGECIDTVGLGQPYRFQIVRIHPQAVEMLVHPELVLHSAGPERRVGALTLAVGETVTLQTLSFDAWGNWVVTLKGIV